MCCERRPPHALSHSSRRSCCYCDWRRCIATAAVFEDGDAEMLLRRGAMVLMVWLATQGPARIHGSGAGAADDGRIARQPPLAAHAAIGGGGDELHNIDQLTPGAEARSCYRLAGGVSAAGDAATHPIAVDVVAAGCWEHRRSCNGASPALQW